MSTRFRKGGWAEFALYFYLALTLAVPFLVMALWAFYDPKTGWFPPDLVPRSYSVSAWREVFADRQIMPSALLSLFVAVIVTLTTTALGFPAAFAMTRLTFGWKRIVEVFVLAPLIVPGIVIAVGLGEVFFKLGLVGTVIGVVLIQLVATLPLTVRILTATLENLPEELVYAARTLGASPFRAVLRVVLPLAQPGIAAASVLTFIGSFEEFEKSFMVGAPKIQPLAVRLWGYLGGETLVLPTAAVVTFILTIPLVALFFVTQRLSDDDAMAAGLGKM